MPLGALPALRRLELFLDYGWDQLQLQPPGAGNLAGATQLQVSSRYSVMGPAARIQECVSQRVEVTVADEYWDKLSWDFSRGAMLGLLQ